MKTWSSALTLRSSAGVKINHVDASRSQETRKSELTEDDVVMTEDKLELDTAGGIAVVVASTVELGFGCTVVVPIWINEGSQPSRSVSAAHPQRFDSVKTHDLGHDEGLAASGGRCGRRCRCFRDCS